MLFEVYMALETAKKACEDGIDALPKHEKKVGTYEYIQASRALDSVLTTMDILWQYCLTDEERAWLDGRKDDGAKG